MSETTIEWTRGPNGEQGYSFNPWVGCTKISVGPQGACEHCYAEAWAKRGGHPELWQGMRRRTAEANWKLPLKWDREAAAAGERRRVFCASLADVFDNQVPDAWRADLFDVIKCTPNLDWLLLTKRIGNAAAMMGEKFLSRTGRVDSNLWLGATFANQEELRRDILKLLRAPAHIHFASLEPLLGPINLREIQIEDPGVRYTDLSFDALTGAWSGTAPGSVDINDTRLSLPRMTPPLDWVIAGSESGSRWRSSQTIWFKDLRAQCLSAWTPFFMKQLTERGRKIPFESFPAYLQVREQPRPT